MQQITAGDRNEQANTKMKRWCGWQRETDTSYGKWPLLSCLDIWIMVGSAAQDTAPRFVDSFQATWSRLPANVQSGLTHTWKSSEDGFPKFFLFDELVDHDSEHGTCGIYSGLAHQPRFDFSGAFVRDMPDCLVETLIAHELAHCLLGHTGDYSEVHESEADTLVESWGFPVGDLRAYFKPRNDT